MKLAKLDAIEPRSPRCCWCLGVVATIGVVFGILMSTVLHSAVDTALRKGIAQQFSIASPEAGGYDSWQNSDAPDGAVTHSAFMVYHINNPYEMLHGAKPDVTAFGPLTYTYHQRKLNVTYSDDGNRVRFITQQYYTADDELTRELENRLITSIDAPLLGLLGTDGGLGVDLLYLMDILADNATLYDFYTQPMALFVNRSIREVLWGWEDPLLQFIGPIIGSPTRYPGLQGNDSSAEDALALHSANTMYCSDDAGVLTRYFDEWNGYSELFCCPYGVCGDKFTGSGPQRPWATSSAETITGSFGDVFHSFVSQDETLFVSTHDFGLYRTWPMTSTESVVIKGITLYSFRWAEGTLGNMSVNPVEAEAYYITGPSGVLNQTTCEWHAPILLSRPHFFGGSDRLWQAIDGLGPPDINRDDVVLNVEPYTGVTMDCHWRALIAINITKTVVGSKKHPKLEWTFFEGVNPVVMPLASLDRYGSMTDEQAEQFKGQVYLAVNAKAVLLWGGTSLAVILALSAAACFMTGYLRHRTSVRWANVAAASYYHDFYKPLQRTELASESGDTLQVGWTQVQ